MLGRYAILLLLIAASARADSSASGSDPDKLNVTFGGFVDAYYAYDFDRPPLHDRPFTTQPARHNEFNVNLAYLDAKASAERVRGRLAIQAGTSVQENYANEPTIGLVSGPSLSRLLQEATAGYRMTDRLWIDAGIFLSHIGLESWISKDNWTYTRSLTADYSPYYEAGVKATYQWSDEFSSQFLVLNGWQTISAEGGNKPVGVQLAYKPSEKVSFQYSNFLGNVEGTRQRFFNDFFGKITLTNELAVAATYDFGWQQNVGKTSSSLWQGYAVLARYQFTPKVSTTARFEQYFDPNQVLVLTGTPNGFQTTSASLNVDFLLHKNLMWRNEVRGYWSHDPVFPSKDQGLLANDGLVVTSLSLWL
jgi:hypothetical protein